MDPEMQDRYRMEYFGADSN